MLPCQRQLTILASVLCLLIFTAVIAKRIHPFPFRTRKLSSSAPMVLHGRLCGRVGHRRFLYKSPFELCSMGLFVFCPRKFLLVSFKLHYGEHLTVFYLFSSFQIWQFNKKSTFKDISTQFFNQLNSCADCPSSGN